jgi:hypothetical protein
MRAKYCVVLLVLVFAAGVNAKPQQHAPTVEVCRADLALWYDENTATEYYKA